MRMGAEALWIWGPFSVQSEYMAAWVNRRYDSADGLYAGPDLFFSSAYVQFSYFFTGEHRKFKKGTAVLDRVSPKKNFWDGKNSLGAMELALRYSYIDLTDEGNDGGRLNNYTVGFNWYLNPNMRIMLNYVFSDLDRSNPGGGTTSSADNTFQMRFQVNW
jgi:phosphate-selective porin OprO/OprP